MDIENDSGYNVPLLGSREEGSEFYQATYDHYGVFNKAGETKLRPIHDGKTQKSIQITFK